jgi:ABC-2 type transport system permease protein
MIEPLLQRRAIATLAHRGLRSYFETPAAYIALLVFFLLTGYFFTVPLFLVGQASIKSLAEFERYLLTFLAPALTMGLLAEELKSGTFECLATMPLEDSDIVLGKFLGFAQFQALAVASLTFFPLALTVLVQPPAGLDWGESAGILCALLLLGLMFGAVGLFASSLSRSQVVAFIIAFLICFAFFAAGKLAVFFPGAAGEVVDFLGIDSHMDTLSKGVFDSRDLLYFASVTAAFLYATVERLQARRA